MNKLKAKLKRQGGFTLIEMLIVVAIIAILIFISLPIVSGAMEKARDATDQANERAAKAEALLYFMGTVSDEELKLGDDSGTPYKPGEALTAYYDAVNGNLKATSKKTDIKAYGQCTKKTGCYQSTSDHTGKIIKVEVDENAKVTITWE